MKVKLVTQVFSFQVASEYYCFSNTNLLPLSVIPTARFVERMDTLFDILNSYKLYVDKLARCGVRSQASILCHWSLSVTTESYFLKVLSLFVTVIF